MRAAGSRRGREGSLSTGGAHPLRLPEGERAWTSIKAVLTVGETSECDRLHRLFAITLMGSGSRAVVPPLVPLVSTPGAGTASGQTAFTGEDGRRAGLGGDGGWESVTRLPDWDG